MLRVPVPPPLAARIPGSPRRRRGCPGLGAMLAVIFLPALIWADTTICGHPPGERVTISRADQTVAVFTVAVAESAAQRRQGLMRCPQLQPGTGMLFVYNDARRRVFWMKDTPVELGIVYITADGTIAAIERGAPESLTRIPSPEAVQFVLEVNLQEAQSLRIGDRLQRKAPD